MLTAVLGSTDPVTFTDLVVRTGLPKSTLSRLTTSLERNGLLQRTATGAWQPGTAITDYALSVRPEDDLVRIAQPYLDALGEQTGETVNLAVPVAGEVRQIAQVDSTYLLGAVNWLDRPVPFHCSALGRVFLAHGTPLPSGRLPRITERTIAKHLYEPDQPDVDLFVRSSGEQRTSNFLLWQAAYAELVFDETLWPDFDRRNLWRAVESYCDRNRRFGKA